MYILNLTQHKSTPAQVEDGVVEPEEECKKKIIEYLTFNDISTIVEIRKKAEMLADLAVKECYRKYVERINKDKIVDIMIGGAPYLMSELEKALRNRYLNPIYAFSKRISKEKTIDGKVIKTQVFEHLGFINTED